MCLWGLGGILAIGLGWLARGEIERSAGRETGNRLAATGIALGILNLGVMLAGFGALVAYAVRPKPPDPSPVPTLAAPRVAPPVRAPEQKPAGPEPGTLSRETGVRVTRVGTITLVDVNDNRSLGEVLEHERQAGASDGQKVLVWLIVPECQPCNAVAAALPDKKMQTALEGVRVVRLDIQDYQRELDQLGFPTEKIPGFALLGGSNRPLDFIHGGEWDADIPKNIAPVLGKFVRGALTRRRDPWHGPRREGETPT